MAAESRIWRVGIIGISPAALFLMERLSIASNIRLAGAFDQDPSRLVLAKDLDCPIWERPLAAISSNETDIVFLMDGCSADLASSALSAGKHVMLGRPWSMSSETLGELADKAALLHRIAMPIFLRRGSMDFAAALAAKKTNRLGILYSVRSSSFENGVAIDLKSAELLREFTYHWVDQLLLLTESVPTVVFAKRFRDAVNGHEIGIFVSIDFASGCSAQIELNLQSRLGYRTGWMMEGASGSFRNGRLFTVSTDGEVVDEPLPATTTAADHFPGELISTWNGERSMLPTLTDAKNVVHLIETIERSANTGDVVRL